MTYLRKILPLIIPFLLMGCEEKLTYPYLMQHPRLLRKEMERCEASKFSTENRKYCDIVLFAAENMFSILRQMGEDPQKFGESLLFKQMTVVKAKIALQKAQEKLETLKKQNATQKEIKEALEYKNKLQKTYDELNEETKVMLAAIGLNTPG